MNYFLIFLICFVFVVSTNHYTENEVELLFSKFKSDYQKSYLNPNEEAYRKAIFEEKLNLVQEHNSDPTKTYKIGINQFSDLTYEEFSSMYLSSLKYPNKKSEHEFKQESNLEDKSNNNNNNKMKGGLKSNPANLWRLLGFDVTEVIESALAKDTGVLIELAPQEALSCTYKDSSSSNPDVTDGYIEVPSSWISDGWQTGCDGGNACDVFQLYALYKTITSSQLYPYADADGICQTYTNYVELSSNEVYEWGYGCNKESEATLETLVANNGPVSVAIYASSTFESYTSGAFASTDCYVNGETNHAVNVVGYLNNYDGYPVWIVRNSWGAGWGQNGYIYEL
ncbi:cysteine proteinases superfamily protein [Anaeramoeba ignava]|uniref:Cysteine proteinases superfamily protein n=1 Tax=Anaeramoeba ignava TaxID=1746090 RepID=A0A9Q0LIV6_ANAIG|nr:cysteine proteinases superfamily protein [Anaeramoeba ignava]